MNLGQAHERNHFGAMLRHLRIRSQLTQEILAERAGLSVRTISGMENGKVVQPRRSSIHCLANALGLEGDQRTDFAELAASSYWAARLMTTHLAPGI